MSIISSQKENATAGRRIFARHGFELMQIAWASSKMPTTCIGCGYVP